MVTHFTERHADNIIGIVNCFDRLVIQGTLPDICHPGAITQYFFQRKIRIFDFKAWAAPLRDCIRKNAESLAESNGLEIEFVRKTDSFRKDDRVKEVIKSRGEHPGLVHIFSAMETCTAFKPWHDKQSHKTFFKYDSGRCLHYYFYFIDKEYGLCYLRIPTWAPFRFQFYCNPHNHVAIKLEKKGVSFCKVENAFLRCEDYAKAQSFSDAFNPKRLHKALNRFARAYCPVLHHFPYGIHWSVMQVEYATDIVFKDKETLAPVYEELVRTLAHAVKPHNLSMFLGRRLDPRFEGELGSQFSTRIEGHCLRHHMSRSGIKMYDKLGSVLRIESYSNDISFFKHHRRVEHRDGSWTYKTAAMKKTIYSLTDLADVMYACNQRYLDFLSAVDDPTNGINNMNRVSRHVRERNRSHRGFNVFADEDATVFEALAQADNHCFGFRNKDLRKYIPNLSNWKASSILKRLRNHSLIKRGRNTYKYFLTSFGRQVIAQMLRIKEMAVIPALRGLLQES